MLSTVVIQPLDMLSYMYKGIIIITYMYLILYVTQTYCDIYMYTVTTANDLLCCLSWGQ